MGTAKYIIFALMALLLAANFMCKTIFEKIFKKEMSDEKIALAKSACLALFLAGTAYIFFA